MNKMEFVDASPLFAALGAPVRARIGEALALRRYERDAPVYLRGDKATAFYGVATGRIRFSTASPDKREVVVDYARPGQWFGEIGLFDGGPRVFDAVAIEPSELFLLSRKELLMLCQKEPSVTLRFLELFSSRIRVAEEVIADASFLNLRARLAKKLLVMAEDITRTAQTAAGVSLRISQDELGRLAGVTRESAGKQLKVWEKEGVVVVEYGGVTILDPVRLRQIVTAATRETAAAED